ncbi:MAG: MqnA/MqnD/SBP family protein [Acidobacteriota bacterium]|nr:MqnA/MqnD/SBP family protein [Acidobacteriota bacterium]
MPKLRVGIPRELYGRPLAWGFLKGHHGDLFSTSLHPQAAIGPLLQRGSLDVGLVSPLDFQRIPGLRALRDLCVAATGACRLMMVVAKEPLAQIRRLAVEHNSHAAGLLAEILLRQRYGVENLELRRHRPVLKRMLANHDGALLTGDDALKLRRSSHAVVDLAEEWNAFTGLPWVVALWAVRDGVGLPDLPFYFKSSLRYGLSLLDNLMRESASELALDVSEIEPTLRGHLSFFLRDEETAGIEEFYRRAAELGLMEAPRPLAYW